MRICRHFFRALRGHRLCASAIEPTRDRPKFSRAGRSNRPALALTPVGEATAAKRTMSQELVRRDGQVADAPAGGVADGVSLSRLRTGDAPVRRHRAGRAAWSHQDRPHPYHGPVPFPPTPSWRQLRTANRALRRHQGTRVDLASTEIIVAVARAAGACVVAGATVSSRHINRG
jgi:hypothetical protein